MAKSKTTNDGRGFRKVELTSLIEVNPEAAKEKVRLAYRLGGATLKGAAKHLDCTDRTLIRWIDKLDMKTELARLSKELEKAGLASPNKRHAHA